MADVRWTAFRPGVTSARNSSGLARSVSQKSGTGSRCPGLFKTNGFPTWFCAEARGRSREWKSSRLNSSNCRFSVCFLCFSGAVLQCYSQFYVVVLQYCLLQACRLMTLIILVKKCLEWSAMYFLLLESVCNLPGMQCHCKRDGASAMYSLGRFAKLLSVIMTS